MRLREALIAQAPSLELQRAAYSEICRLDAQLAAARELLVESIDQVCRDTEEAIREFLNT